MRVLQPVSPLAGDIARLFHGLLILSYVIFGLVTALVVFALWRYRARSVGQEPGTPRRGHSLLEITWTALPLLTVAVIFFFTIRVMYSTEPNYVPPDPAIQITGHQWWWEARYSNGAYTANEIHIPAGARVPVWILAGDVIHDFWVPELGPKIDAVPGRTNALWLEADHPGTYLGACAEYCGNQHAWMLIRVIAQPPEEFANWLAAQAAIPPAPPGGDAANGAKIFREKSCISCHTIAGVGPTPRVGPDLTHFASRETLGAGILPNTPENLERWLRDPQQIKPGILMPNVKLNEDEVRAVGAYLESLR
jgi:cytochrome c oxidase subunit II